MAHGLMLTTICLAEACLHVTAKGANTLLKLLQQTATCHMTAMKPLSLNEHMVDSEFGVPKGTQPAIYRKGIGNISKTYLGPTCQSRSLATEEG